MPSPTYLSGLLLFFLVSSCRVAPPLTLVDAVLSQGRLLVLTAQGQLLAWRVPAGTRDHAYPGPLALPGLRHLATGDGHLWAVAASTLYRWAPLTQVWEPQAVFHAGSEPLQALRVVAGIPILIFARHLEMPTTGDSVGLHHGRRQRLLTVYATESMLWLGTGAGEWGGSLLGFAIPIGKGRAGASDDVHYVTGIAQVSPEQVLVSWAMSHVDAETLLRLHALDGTVLQDFPVVRGHYYQQLVSNPYDGLVYGVDDHDVVLLTASQPTLLAGLEGEVLTSEPLAAGVAPGMLASLPLAPQTLVLVPQQGLPWLYRQGLLRRLPG